RAPVRRRRRAVEIIERLRQTEREARPLDEGAVGAERGAGVIEAGVVGVEANGEIAAHGAVFGLVARVGRDVAAATPGAVAGRAVVDVVVRPTPRNAAVVAVSIFGAH